MKGLEGFRAEGHIVSEGESVEIFNFRHPHEEGVIGQSEEEWGKGATLLDPPLDVNPDVRATPEDRVDPSPGEEGSHQRDEPTWQPNLF